MPVRATSDELPAGAVVYLGLLKRWGRNYTAHSRRLARSTLPHVLLRNSTVDRLVLSNNPRWRHHVDVRVRDYLPHGTRCLLPDDPGGSDDHRCDSLWTRLRLPLGGMFGRLRGLVSRRPAFSFVAPCHPHNLKWLFVDGVFLESEVVDAQGAVCLIHCKQVIRRTSFTVNHTIQHTLRILLMSSAHVSIC